MRRQLVTFTLFLALSAAAAADVTSDAVAPPPLPWTPLTVDGTECNGLPAGQKVCSKDCGEVLMCMGGTLDPIVLETCNSTSKCDAQQGECVNGLDSCGAPIMNITCHALGMFPDPNLCTAFHICAVGSELSTYAQCDGGRAYDPVTTLCSKPLDDNVCRNLPIECTSLGDSNAFPGAPNIYYICVHDYNGELQPELYRCPHGGTFSPGSLSCSDNL